MRHFSFRPALTFRGREFKGLRGFSGKPLHPPLTDIPIGAYVIAAAFDVISFIGDQTAWQREFYQAATFVFIAGALVSLGAVVTGLWDRWRSSEAGTQARRTINAHALLMVVMTVLVLVDLGLRWFRYHALAGPTSALLGTFPGGRSSRRGRRHLRGDAGVRLRLQRRDCGRPSRVAPL